MFGFKGNEARRLATSRLAHPPGCVIYVLTDIHIYKAVKVMFSSRLADWNNLVKALHLIVIYQV